MRKKYGRMLLQCDLPLLEANRQLFLQTPLRVNQCACLRQLIATKTIAKQRWTQVLGSGARSLRIVLKSTLPKRKYLQPGKELPNLRPVAQGSTHRHIPARLQMVIQHATGIGRIRFKLAGNNG